MCVCVCLFTGYMVFAHRMPLGGRNQNFQMGQPAVGVCVLCCAKVLDLIAAQCRTKMVCWHISQKCQRCSSRLRAIQGCEYKQNNPGSIHPEPVDAPTSRQQQKCDHLLVDWFWNACFAVNGSDTQSRTGRLLKWRQVTRVGSNRLKQTAE